MDYMILAATNLGLGTCFIAAFNSINARKVLSLPDDVEPILFTPLGYPDDFTRNQRAKETRGISSLRALVRLINWYCMMNRIRWSTQRTPHYYLLQ